MRKPVIYISGPITTGDRVSHFAAFCNAHRALLRAGFAPVNPGLTMLLPFAWSGEINHADWLAADLPIVELCDAVLRLDGFSVGADIEVEHATIHGIPVFDDFEDLVEAFEIGTAEERSWANE